MDPYLHRVQYYETDRMGISHHSNYIRWMEEARIYYLSQIGWSFHKLEEEGIFSPVTAVACQYKRPTTFADEVAIVVRIDKFSGVRLVISYEMTNAASGEVVCVGTTEHVFLTKDAKPLRLKKEFPGFYEALCHWTELDSSQI